MRAGQVPDPIYGQRSKQRSVHHNYFTLPLLFIMISNHDTSTYAQQHGWAGLALISVAAVSIRHFSIARTRVRISMGWYPYQAARKFNADDRLRTRSRRGLDRRWCQDKLTAWCAIVGRTAPGPILGSARNDRGVFTRRTAIVRRGEWEFWLDFRHELHWMVNLSALRAKSVLLTYYS